MEGLINFFSDNALYIVLIIVLIVWTGIFLYMLNLDKRLKSLENDLGDENEK